MDLFLNELSIEVASNSYEAQRNLEKFGNLVSYTTSKGFGDVRTPMDFKTREFGPSYRFHDWLAEHDNETRELKSLLLGKIATTPYIEELLDVNSLNQDRIVEFSFQSTICLGLGLASPVVFDSIALSFDSESWATNLVPIEVAILEEDEIKNTVVDVRNASCPEHVESHNSWSTSLFKPVVQSGRELWAKRSDLFPRLIFCDNTRAQLNAIQRNRIDFRQILDRLHELNRFCEEWPDNTGFNPDRFASKVDPESSTRLKDFVNELTIQCPDGKYKLFSWHARFTPGAGRIHFIEDISNRMLIIGSIANQNTVK